jgi:CelD/BcsL family acetyltransferase involved in cellulose biosynthesis
MLSKSHRKRCRRLHRKFFGSGTVKIHQVECEAELQEGFEILINLHAARWGNTKQPLGVFADPKFLAFHQMVSRKLLNSNNLRLAWLEHSGIPLAIEYQFVDTQAVYAYQAGVDINMDEYAPGNLSLIAAIQFAINRSCKFFDLLSGDDPYKAHWGATPRPCYDLRVWQKQPAGLLAWTLWSGYTQAARRLKPILPPPLINRGLEVYQAMQEAYSNFRRRNR